MKNVLFRNYKIKILPFKHSWEISGRLKNIFKFKYEIRHADRSWAEPSTIEPRVLVNHWGTILSMKEIPELHKTPFSIKLTEKEIKCFIS